jgi:hypothetical protein
MWQKIIETYRALPEDARTPLDVSERLDAQGHPNVSPARIRVVLRALVVSEIAPDAIATTAQTLKILHDVALRSMDADQAARAFVSELVHGLPVIGNPVSLADTLASIVANYERYRDDWHQAHL